MKEFVGEGEVAKLGIAGDGLGVRRIEVDEGHRPIGKLAVGDGVFQHFDKPKVAAIGGDRSGIVPGEDGVQALRINSQTVTDTFTYTVTDTAGATSSTTLNINVHGANDAPVAVADTGTAVEKGGVSNGSGGSNATGNVLANDTDVDGDVVVVTRVGEAAHGTTALTATGVTPTGVLYTPAPNFNGTDSFTYTVSDGHGGTANATVTVTVTVADVKPKPRPHVSAVLLLF